MSFGVPDMACGRVAGAPWESGVHSVDSKRGGLRNGAIELTLDDSTASGESSTARRVRRGSGNLVLVPEESYSQTRTSVLPECDVVLEVNGTRFPEDRIHPEQAADLARRLTSEFKRLAHRNPLYRWRDLYCIVLNEPPREGGLSPLHAEPSASSRSRSSTESSVTPLPRGGGERCIKLTHVLGGAAFASSCLMFGLAGQAPEKPVAVRWGAALLSVALLLACLSVFYKPRDRLG